MADSAWGAKTQSGKDFAAKIAAALSKHAKGKEAEAQERRRAELDAAEEERKQKNKELEEGQGY